MKQDELCVEPYPWLHIQWEDGDAEVVVVCAFWAVGCFSCVSVVVVVVCLVVADDGASVGRRPGHLPTL
jgi:hypothetical protein